MGGPLPLGGFVRGEMSGEEGWRSAAAAAAAAGGSLNWKVAKVAVAGVEGWDLRRPGERAEAAKTVIRRVDLSSVRSGLVGV